MKKIIQIINSLDIGGAEYSLLKVVKSLNSEKVEFIVVSLTSGGSISEELSKIGVKTYFLGYKSPLSLPKVFFNLCYFLRKERPEIVHTWLYHSDLIGGIAAKIIGVKCIYWNIRTTELKKHSYLTTFIRTINTILSYIIPTKTICAAEATMKKHISYGYNRKNMYVITNGYDASAFKSCDNSLKACDVLEVDTNTIIIGSIARFNHIKGHDTFIDACNIVYKKLNNVYFLMLGRNVDESNIIMNDWIQNTDCPNHFLLKGEQLDLSKFFGVMDIFCLHSRSEGFPNVLGEAMIFAVPCVATDVGDASSLGGNLVKLIPPDNPECLAEALIATIKLPKETKREIGQLSRERIKRDFSISKMISSYSKLYSINDK